MIHTVRYISFNLPEQPTQLTKLMYHNPSGSRYLNRIGQNIPITIFIVFNIAPINSLRSIQHIPHQALLRNIILFLQQGSKLPKRNITDILRILRQHHNPAITAHFFFTRNPQILTQLRPKNGGQTARNHRIRLF
uniref:Uncharacterized protein n=1 Tax=Opuntia streptacantha TaxID=393608 RepID=A0A7C9E9A6_OPUST